MARLDGNSIHNLRISLENSVIINLLSLFGKQAKNNAWVCVHPFPWKCVLYLPHEETSLNQLTGNISDDAIFLNHAAPSFYLQLFCHFMSYPIV